MSPALASLIFGVALILTSTRLPAADFILTSLDLDPQKPLEDAFIFDGFGCTGGNESPALKWSGAPSGTLSFAVGLYDQNGINGRGFWHWLVVNVPGNVTSLPRDAGRSDGSKLPRGAEQVRNGFRASGYSGSCPPPSDDPHTYVLTVYALKVAKLEVAPDATGNAMFPIIDADTLGKASISYRFGRKPPPAPEG
jgi:Raf kinase inhibitor-like YbhB/YbcL family protein